MLELYMSKFKEILEARMLERGFNRRSLAIACGMQEFAIQSIAAGKSLNPRIDTMAKIADALDCSIDELYGRKVKEFLPIQDVDMWANAVERVDKMILESKNNVDARTRAALYLACYEFNFQGVEIKDANQLNTLLKFFKTKHQ